MACSSLPPANVALRLPSLSLLVSRSSLPPSLDLTHGYLVDSPSYLVSARCIDTGWRRPPNSRQTRDGTRCPRRFAPTCGNDRPLLCLLPLPQLLPHTNASSRRCAGST